MKKIVCLFVCLLAGAANANLVTFNGTASNGGFTNLPSSYSEAGFTLTNNSGNNYFIDNDYSNLTLNPWDDDVLEFNSSTTSKTTFTADGGANFDFNSAYLGSLNSAASLRFEGFFNGGGSIFQTVSLGLDTRTLFNFTGFNNLTRLEITAPTDGNYAIMDDFTINESHSVPEPISLALIGLGLAGISFSRRKKSI